MEDDMLSILIVNDDRSLIELFTLILEGEGGLKTVSLSSIDELEILNEVQKRQPTLVLLDLFFTRGKRGIQIFKIIQDRFPKVKIIFTTSVNESVLGQFDHPIMCGFDDIDTFLRGCFKSQV